MVAEQLVETVIPVVPLIWIGCAVYILFLVVKCTCKRQTQKLDFPVGSNRLTAGPKARAGGVYNRLRVD